MTTERESFDVVERGSSGATQEVAIQAWDSSNWRGNNPRTDEGKLTFVDMGSNDIYNTRRGNRDINNGNSDLQSAENRISRVVDQLLDGNYDSNKLVKELQRSDNSLDGATSDFKNGIKRLGASSTVENLDDMVDGRRDVIDADKKVENAIKQLRNGDENGAIKSLLQSLGEIDSAQQNFRDSKTDQDERPRSGPRDNGHGNGNGHGHGDGQGLNHGHGDDCKDGDFQRGGKENTNDYRPGNRSNDGLVYDHMYRDEDRMWAGGTPDFDETGGGGFDIPFDDPRGVQLDPVEYIWGTGAGYRARDRYNNDNDYGRTHRDMWGSGDLNPPSLDDILRTGDQVSQIADPLGLFPRPSDVTDPKKVVRRAIDPLGIFS